MDPEIQALGKVMDAVKDLDDAAIQRIIRWLEGRYGEISTVQRQPEAVESAASEPEEDASVRDLDRIDDLGELFMSAAPKTQPEKVLVVGYWFQVYGGQDDIDSYTVNRELKHLGHGVAKITRAFNGLIEQRPQLAIQVRKSGKSRQARKKYRITAAGIGRVKDMIGMDRD